MKTLIVYFSREGTVKAIAEGIGAELKGSTELTVARIEPVRVRGYWGWLCRSFVPRYRVSIRPTVTDLNSYDVICLGFPKWTYACPPVNQYLLEMKNCEGKDFALFMCHRGFDQERYFESMVKQVSEKGGRIVAALDAKQSAVLDDSYRESLKAFCDRIKRSLEPIEDV
ncbi:MAG: hypothetical protein V3R94_09535 [Acidobacteriota bacterium]